MVLIGLTKVSKVITELSFMNREVIVVDESHGVITALYEKKNKKNFSKGEPNMKQEEKDETTREEVVIPAGYTPEEYLDVGQECPDEEPEKIVEVKLKYGE